MAVTMLSALPAMAQDPKPEDVIEFRQGVYKIIGWYFGPLGAMAKGDAPFDSQVAARNAQIVADMSMIAPDAFVRGSDRGQTGVLPEVWSKPQDFAKVMDNFQQQTAKLAEVAQSGDFDAFRAQVGETGKACKACHDDFRKKRR
jgi:cytochrome c556